MIDEKKLIGDLIPILNKNDDMFLAGRIIGTIDRQPQVGGWIPVTERLPENAQHKGAFCPKYQVMTKYGVTEGWYNPDRESWYILFWFMTTRFHETDIDFKRGDIPKVVKIPLKAEMLTTWQPLPEPYKESEQE